MNNRDRLSDLEDILAEIEGQSTEEMTADLRKAGIDTDAFLQRANKVMQEQYRKHLRELEEEQHVAPVVPLFFADVANMNREELMMSFATLQNGSLGETFKQAALARCRNKDTAELSDDDLRSWLKDIAEISRHDDGNNPAESI